jgi:phosphoribosylaminoimidazole carboxylase PurK protein
MTETRPTIGIVGGGQLGQMLTLAALPLGFQVIVVDPTENCPAAQVGAVQIRADLYDPDALRELGRRADYVTIEIEHIDAATLESLAAEGVKVNPTPGTIRLIQDKLGQKQFLADAGVPVADFAELPDAEAGLRLMEKFGGAMIVKTRLGAYDGRGNMVVRTPGELKNAFKRFAGQPLYAEKLVEFSAELAVMVARGAKGEVATYAAAQTRHERNICVETLTPAPTGAAAVKAAHELAKRVAGLLEGAGMFGIEMFLTASGYVLVNEIAPRVHNSGHYTLGGSRTSQFEQHIRAITGLPLGETTLVAPAVAMVNLLGEGNHTAAVRGLAGALAIPGVRVHIYGKSKTKIDRKMGHITALGDSLEEARIRAHKARKELSI